MELINQRTDLVVLERNIPIRSIPEQELNRIILSDFTVWVAKLLSLTNETSAERLEVALPAIKEHCWSMGFAEITKMFEMYADNKLSIEPIPNYLDRILVGKIAKAYRDQKPRKKVKVETKELPDEEKQILIYTGVMNCFEKYKETGYIISGYLWVYDFFYEKKQLPKHTKEFREKILKQAKVLATDDISKNPNRQSSVYKIVSDMERAGSLKAYCKRVILQDFFDKLIKNKTDIKTVMK